MNKKLISRLKSLAWRSGMMALTVVIAAVVTGGDIFNLDYQVLVNLGVITFLGLVGGEISRILNSRAK